MVVLAVSRPEKNSPVASVSTLLRYSFCGICGNELEGLALVAKDKNHFLLAGQPFCYFIYWCGDTQKRHLGFFVHPLITQHFYCGQDSTQECAKAHIRWMLPLVFLAWGTFWESYSAPPQRGIRGKGQIKQCLGGKKLELNLGCHQVYP